MSPTANARFPAVSRRASERAGTDTIERFQGELWFTFDPDTSTVDRDNGFHLGRTADRAGDI